MNVYVVYDNHYSNEYANGEVLGVLTEVEFNKGDYDRYDVFILNRLDEE